MIVNYKFGDISGLATFEEGEVIPSVLTIYKKPLTEKEKARDIKTTLKERVVAQDKFFKLLKKLKAVYTINK